MSCSDGVEVFSQFLRKEFSEENIEFWLACEEFRRIDSETKMLSKAKYIYTVFCEPDSPKEVRWCIRVESLGVLLLLNVERARDDGGFHYWT